MSAIEEIEPSQIVTEAAAVADLAMAACGPEDLDPEGPQSIVVPERRDTRYPRSLRVAKRSDQKNRDLSSRDRRRARGVR